MSAPAGGFTLVLHTHLPWVLHHGRWPHGSDWLCEAVAECYLPLLEVLEPRARAGRSLGITLSLSPVLLDQLESPAFSAEFRSYLEAKCAAARADARRFAAAGRTREAGLARRWEGDYDLARARWTGGDDLLARFGRLASRGAVELIACAATHAYLPLQATPVAVRRQVALAIESHRRRFGVAPRGLWLPECAYRPGGPWQSAVEPEVREAWRPGLERVLESFGIEYFLVETHLITGGAPIGIASETRRRSPRTTRARVAPGAFLGPGTDRVHRVYDSTVACLGRDALTSQQVWSREGGYPGDPAYREFHKRHHPGGLRYWAVTDVRASLDDKAIYDPDAARRRVADHATHLLASVASRFATADPADRPVVCAMYDTELFGHWWHEGPAFLAEVLDRAPGMGVPLATAAEQVDAARRPAPLALAEGSWGSGGRHDTWLAPETRAMWTALHEAERRFEAVARRVSRRDDPALDRVLRQALRELLLLEASDWPFLVTQRSARDYAEARARDHARDTGRLLDLAERVLDRSDPGTPLPAAPLDPADETLLAQCERRDGLFPWLDWRTGLGPAEISAAASAPAVRAARRAPAAAFRRARGSSAASSRSRAGRRPRRDSRDS